MSVRSIRWRLAEAIAPGPIRGVFGEDDTEWAMPRYDPAPPSAEVIAEWAKRGIIKSIPYDALPRVLDDLYQTARLVHIDPVDAAARLRDLGFPDYDYLP